MEITPAVFTKPTKLKWSFRNENITPEQTEAAAKEYGVPRFIAAVLLSRETEDIRQFLLKPKKIVRHPGALPDIDDAVRRIMKAAKRKEKVIVYGDYDVDGMTSVAMMTDFLRHIGINADYYIPERVTEGYGLNSAAIERMAADGVKLIVTVDCGVTNIEESLTAFKNNVDLVITDHHTCLDELPFASAVVNPKRPDSSYGFTGLAGVGVAFKVCLAVGLEAGIPSNTIFERYCALAAIGTVADVVPLTDENRVIVAKGLDAIARREFVGIDAILDMAGIDKASVVSSTISFVVAPKLNAAGRLGDPKTAVRLLMTSDRREAKKTAAELDELNNKRRSLESEVYGEIMGYLRANPFELCERIVVVKGTGWNHGVIGRVAAMITERLYRPCIVVSFDGTKGKGSCRGIEGFDMFEALADSAEFLDDFGGHKAAAGLSLTLSNWTRFRTNICRYSRRIFVDANAIAKNAYIDCEIFPEEITLENARRLPMLEPFGTDNPRPVFIVRGLKIEEISLVGTEKQHMRAYLSYKGTTFNAIGFGLSALEAKFKEGNLVDCVFTMEINSYNGEDSVQLRLIDMKWSEVYFRQHR